MPARVQSDDQRMADNEQVQNQAQEQEQEQEQEMELGEEEERDGQMFDMDQQRITLVCALSHGDFLCFS